MSRRIAVVGGGAWGSALALHLARCGHAVRLWMRETDLVERMRTRGDNPLYLPGVRFPESVVPDDRLEPVLHDAEIVIAAVPSLYARSVYREMAPLMAGGVPLIVATKGIEEGSLALPLEAAGAELGETRPMAALSGPSFAMELAAGKATAVVVASRDATLAGDIQRICSSGVLRLYTNDDPLGVQVAAALKNVIAIAAGAADSLSMGLNAQAALITRGLAEIARLGVALGARAETFSGLAGLGDLVLTCAGELSRNRQVGQRLGRGERLKDIVGERHSVAEGVGTARSAHDLAHRAGVQMPIVEQVYHVLYEDGSPQEALETLMNRPLTAEHHER